MKNRNEREDAGREGSEREEAREGPDTRTNLFPLLSRNKAQWRAR